MNLPIPRCILPEATPILLWLITNTCFIVNRNWTEGHYMLLICYPIHRDWLFVCIRHPDYSQPMVGYTILKIHMSQWLTKDVFLQVNNMSPQGVFQLQLQVAYIFMSVLLWYPLQIVVTCVTNIYIFVHTLCVYECL